MRMKLLVSLACLAFLAGGPAAPAGEDAAAHYRAGRKAEAARDFKTALAEYDEVLDLDEDYEDAFERWDACQKLAEWQESLEGRKPGAADLVRLGEVYYGLNRFEDERKCYEDALRLDPNLSEAHGHLALWYYTRGGKIADVVRETLRFLETSPYREHLGRAIADFKVYGVLRTLGRPALADVLTRYRKAYGKDRRAAAGILEEAAGRKDIPDAFRTWLYARAGRTRMAGGDLEGARRDFRECLKHVACASTLQARLGLAALDVREGKLAAALENLRAAVAEGSAACKSIAAQREKAFRPLFESDDPAVREEMKRLSDPVRGDDPIRERIKAACARAAKEGKLVLLEAYGPYCPSVMAMEETLAHPEVRAVISEKYVLVRLDYGAHHRGMSVDAQYGDLFQTFGVPCFLVLDPDGDIVSIEKDAALYRVENRCYDPARLAKWLTETANEG